MDLKMPRIAHLVLLVGQRAARDLGGEEQADDLPLVRLRAGDSKRRGVGGFDSLTRVNERTAQKWGG